MVIRYFNTTAKLIIKVKKRGNFLRTHTYIVAFVLLISVLDCVSAYSQAAINNPRYGTRIETVTRADIKFLPEERRPLSDQYQRSISNTNKELFDKKLIPFYPYFDLNLDPKFLPPAPFRIYLGKRSQENKNDYVLVIVQCIRRRADTTKYADSAISAAKGAKVSPVWYSVKVAAFGNSQDRITYTEETNKQARSFVTNFKIFLRNQKLTDRYPTCVIFKGRSARDIKFAKRLRLQPVVKMTPPIRPGKINGGSKSVHGVKGWKFLDMYTIEDADSRVGTCCEAPPENGNSIQN